MGATGGGATVAWTGSAGGAVITSSRITRIGSSVKTGESVPDDDLASQVAKMIAGDLTTYGPIEIEVPWDKSEFDTLPVYETGTLTVTTAVDASGNVATIVGAAFVLSKSFSTIENNSRIMMTYTFQPTGALVMTDVTPP